MQLDIVYLLMQVSCVVLAGVDTVRVVDTITALVTLAGVAHTARPVCRLTAFNPLTFNTAFCGGGCGHGTCVGYNTCSCNFGWEGRDCMTRMLFP